MGASEPAIVLAFNEAINAGDVVAVARLMHEKHRFIDSGGAIVAGKAACLAAWRGFLDAFPEYRNVFDDVRCDIDGAVYMQGRSECSVPALAGPARWRAVVKDGLLLEWQVSDDLGETSRMRARAGVLGHAVVAPALEGSGPRSL